MGGAQSGIRDRERQTRLSRAFYLVFGSPSIRYIGDDAGPLIYDVNLDMDDDELHTDHTEALQLPNAIPTKQDFVLVPCVDRTNRQGYRLQFNVSCEEYDDDDDDNDNDRDNNDDAGSGGGGGGTGEKGSSKAAGVAAKNSRSRRSRNSRDDTEMVVNNHDGLRYPIVIRVLAGVRVKYKPGKGVVLVPAEKSQKNPVVLEMTTFTSPQLETTEPIQLHKLCRTTYLEDEQEARTGADGTEVPPATAPAAGARKRIATAPVCIVTLLSCDGKPEEEEEEEEEEGEGEEGQGGKSDKNDDDSGADDGSRKRRGGEEDAGGGVGDSSSNQASGAFGGAAATSEEDASISHHADPTQTTTRAPSQVDASWGGRSDADTATGHRSSSRRRGGAGKESGKSTAAVTATATATARTKTKRGATRLDVVLYTFIDFPQDAYELRDVDASGGGSTREDPRTAPAPLTYKGHVTKQLMQVGAEVYELEDVFDLGAEDDIGPSGNNLSGGEDDDDEGDGGECVICLTNPKDTTILPCRHMCLCYTCAGQLRLSSNKCPICRCDIERVMTL